MRLYLDDDSTDGVLIRMYLKAGYDVMLPADVGLSGEDDVVHMMKAVDEGRVLLSHNYRDFEHLHNLIQRTGGVHPGVLVIRRENNPARDMTRRGIVRAIEKLIAANVPIENQFIVLNQWR